MRRFVLVLMIAVGLSSASCAEATGDPFDKLPKSIGGEVLQYNVSHGAQSEPWAKAVLESTGLPDSTLTSATGFTSPGDREYQSYVVRVEGADGRALVRPLIEAFGIFENVREESIAGKTVARYDVRGSQPSGSWVTLAYSFDDMAVAIYARRPHVSGGTRRVSLVACSRDIRTKHYGAISTACPTPQWSLGVVGRRGRSCRGTLS